jgi:hypothetical protein
VLAFEQTPRPEPSGSETLIRVRAAGGLQQTPPLTPGADIAGVAQTRRRYIRCDECEGTVEFIVPALNYNCNWRD